MKSFENGWLKQDRRVPLAFGNDARARSRRSPRWRGRRPPAAAHAFGGCPRILPNSASQLPDSRTSRRGSGRRGGMRVWKEGQATLRGPIGSPILTALAAPTPRLPPPPRPASAQVQCAPPPRFRARASDVCVVIFIVANGRGVIGWVLACDPIPPLAPCAEFLGGSPIERFLFCRNLRPVCVFRYPWRTLYTALHDRGVDCGETPSRRSTIITSFSGCDGGAGARRDRPRTRRGGARRSGLPPP
jgi:hypothetical protein